MTFCNAVASRFLLVALTFLGARYLSAHDFGVFAIIMSSASSIATLSALGIGVVNNTVGARHYAEDPDFVSSVFTGVLAICIALSLVFALAFLPSLAAMDSGFSRFTLLGILFLVSALMTISGASEGLAFGLGRVGTMLVISLLVLIIAPAASVLLMRSNGLAGAVAALVIFRVLQSGLLFTALMASTRIRIAPVSAWRNQSRLIPILLGTSLPLSGAAALAAPVTTVAMLILQNSAGTKAVASFALAYQMFLVLVFPLGSMSQLLVSRLAAKGDGRLRILRKALTYLGCYGLLGWALMIATTFLMPFITANVPIHLPLTATLGGAAMFYALTIGFNSYWVSTERAGMVFVAQFAWAAPFMATTFLAGAQEGALAATTGFLLGSVAQVGVHFLAGWRSSRNGISL